MKICMVGAGYVGLVSAAVLSSWGNEVVCVDNNTQKVEEILTGKLPVYEVGLQELVNQNMTEERLGFTSDFPQALVDRDVVIIAVGTPSGEDGHPNLTALWSVLINLKVNVKHDITVIIKSTIPVGTSEVVSQFLNEESKCHFSVIFAPEFLRQGTAVQDFLHPDRLVIGCRTDSEKAQMADLFQPLDCPKIFTDWHSAEMIKYASNTFLAMKISYINTIANLCEAVGGNINDVAYSVGLDRRIGTAFLKPGVGFGGSCLTKDTLALVSQGEAHGVNVWLFRDILSVNYKQRLRVVDQLKETLGNLRGKKIAVLGLAFKANTDDMRDAPSLTIISHITKMGGHVRAYDPVVDIENFKSKLSFSFANDPYEATLGADAVILLTEWEEFRALDLKHIQRTMNYPLFIDGRHMFEKKKLEEVGFITPRRISLEKSLTSA